MYLRKLGYDIALHCHGQSRDSKLTCPGITFQYPFGFGVKFFVLLKGAENPDIVYCLGSVVRLNSRSIEGVDSSKTNSCFVPPCRHMFPVWYHILAPEQQDATIFDLSVPAAQNFLLPQQKRNACPCTIFHGEMF